MLENTPMRYSEHSNVRAGCQQVPRPPARIGAQQVIAAVVWAYAAVHPGSDVTAAAILGPSRITDIAWARHVCAYLLVEDGKLTCKATATALGRRDHTTILHSRAQIAAALGRDDALRRLLERTRERLAGRPQSCPQRYEEDRKQAFAAATPRDLAEYRYWRLRSLRAGGA